MLFAKIKERPVQDWGTAAVSGKQLFFIPCLVSGRGGVAEMSPNPVLREAAALLWEAFLQYCLVLTLRVRQEIKMLVRGAPGATKSAGQRKVCSGA